MMNNNMNNNNVNKRSVSVTKLAIGDKIKLVKPIGHLGENFVGDVYEITKYEGGVYYFECPYGMGCFTPNEFDAHFELCDDDEYEKCDDVVDMWTAMVDAYHKAMNDMGYDCEHDECNCEHDERGCECHECHCNHNDNLNDDFEFDMHNVPDYIQDILNESELVCDTVFDNCAVVCCKLPNGYVIVENSASVDADEFDYEEQVEICMDRIIDKVISLEAYRDMWDYMMEDKEEESDVDVDDIDIEKLHKSVQEIENQRIIDEIDKRLADMCEEDYERKKRIVESMNDNNMNRKKYDMNLRMNPWWKN